MANADRLIEIFGAAKARPAGVERERLLALMCDQDLELKEQVTALLQWDASAGEFLNRSIANATVPLIETAGQRVGRYKLLEKIGEGGCGDVYIAEQTEPVRRQVALKVIKLGMDTKAVVARFEAERQAVAMMDHPNIAKVLDAGTTETGRAYFVMELVRGLRITEYCDQNSLSTKERLDLFIKVCHAIQHAHQKGIIHRDIKPSNILVTLHEPDGLGIPKVIDFGIAKATEGRLTNATVYTQLHQFIGTPAYMSPEQAGMSSDGSADIDTRSDIYSLGVLLYELLTGTTPFDGQELLASGVDAMRKTIREKEPAKPSTRLSQELAAGKRAEQAGAGSPRSEMVLPEDAPGLPSPGPNSERDRRSAPRGLRRTKARLTDVCGDLDWIVMKCLEKDRSRRYATANGLAADLQRHLSNEAVSARPPAPLYRLQKTVRRNKLAFTSGAAVLTAVLIGLLVATWFAIRATKAEKETRGNLYAAQMNLAFQALGDHNLGQARHLLDLQRPKAGQADLRGFEWRHLWELCKGDEFATFHDSGAQAAAFSPDGKLVVYSDWDKLIVREVGESNAVRHSLPQGAVTLSFAPHTNLLAAGHVSGVKLWNTDTWKMERSLASTVEPALFSPDGRWLLTGGRAGAFQLWDTRTWRVAGECPGAPQLSFQARNAVAFSPDSQFVVTVAGPDRTGDHLCVWPLPSLAPGLPGIWIKNQALGPNERPGSVAFSVDGKYLVVGLWSGDLVVIDFATQKEKARLSGHKAWVTSVAFATDGQTFVTSSSDRTLNVWDANTFAHRARLRGHVGEVWCVGLSPDGRLAVSGSVEGRPWLPRPSTRLWRLDVRHSAPLLEGAHLVAGSLDRGRRIVATTTNGWRIWTPESGLHVDWPVPISPPIVDWGQPFDVKREEPTGAIGRSDGSIELWQLNTGVKVTTWSAHRSPISVLAFSPNGRRLASATTNGEVKIWELSTQQRILQPRPFDGRPLCLTFSADGEMLAASGESSNVWLWSVATGQVLLQLPGHGDTVPSVAFSPHGKLLATTTFVANEARLWELPSGKELPPLTGHVSGVTAVEFSPDGKTLATAGFDTKVKLWNVATRQEMATFSMGTLYPTLRFSPDGRTLIVGNPLADSHVIQILSAPSFGDIEAQEAKREKLSIHNFQ